MTADASNAYFKLVINILMAMKLNEMPSDQDDYLIIP